MSHIGRVDVRLRKAEHVETEIGVRVDERRAPVAWAGAGNAGEEVVGRHRVWRQARGRCSALFRLSADLAFTCELGFDF